MKDQPFKLVNKPEPGDIAQETILGVTEGEASYEIGREKPVEEFKAREENNVLTLLLSNEATLHAGIKK